MSLPTEETPFNYTEIVFAVCIWCAVLVGLSCMALHTAISFRKLEKTPAKKISHGMKFSVIGIFGTDFIFALIYVTCITNLFGNDMLSDTWCGYVVFILYSLYGFELLLLELFYILRIRSAFKRTIYELSNKKVCIFMTWYAISAVC